LDKGLGGAKSWLGWWGVEKISSPYQELNPSYPAHNPVLCELNYPLIWPTFMQFHIFAGADFAIQGITVAVMVNITI
jgi:hypothetical protein